MANPFIVRFKPSGAEAFADGATPLLELARGLGLELESSCGGRGICRSCAVRIEGVVPEPSECERAQFQPGELAKGWRRACQFVPAGPCTVHVPAKTARGKFSAGKEARENSVAIAEPMIAWDFQQRSWRRGTRAIVIAAGESPLGLAVDLGTTNIAAALVDMASGRILASESAVNPQVAYGADVISRLEHALRGTARARELQSAASEAIAALAAQMTGGALPRIAEVAVAGNTVMQHLLLGLPVASLARAPYTPAVLHAVELPAAGLGWTFASEATLYCAPNVAGFIGGDHLSALLAVASAAPAGRWAMLDIGTNTEIALYADGRITSASCASGPAFEGGKLTCGMRAAPGAIDRVAINGGVKVSTIGQHPAVGICGSGVLSILAALKRAGIVDKRGRMSCGHGSMRETSAGRELVLRDGEGRSTLPVVFTQADVRAVQLAKSAIRTGLDILLDDAGLAAGDLDRIFIAGTFGRFVDIRDAFAIGLLPEMPDDRVVQVGNAAGAGVCRLVACSRARREVDAMARRIRYLELATAAAFQRTFIARSMM